MALFNELNSASFRGIPFLLDSSEVEAGRKIVSHEFVNDSRRYVEDLGGLLKVVKIKGVISEPNYRINRDALIRALETPGIGTLIHPFFGTIQVVPEPYTLHERMQSLGEATFEMTFREAAENILPTQSSNNEAIINQIAGAILAGAGQSFGGVWNVGNQFKYNFQNAQQILGSLSNQLSSVIDPFDTSLSAKSTYQTLLEMFNANVNKYILQPETLGASVSTLFSSLDTLSGEPRERFNLSQNFFNYGAGILLPQPTTFKRQQLIANNLILFSLVNINCLANCYNAAANIDFQDEADLNYIEDQLDDQFYTTIDNSTLDDDVLNALKELRNQVRKLFDIIRLNIRRLVPIYTNQTTLTVLTYAYYNSLDNDSLLANLNKIYVPNNISGNLDIVTNQ